MCFWYNKRYIVTDSKTEVLTWGIMKEGGVRLRVVTWHSFQVIQSSYLLPWLALLTFPALSASLDCVSVFNIAQQFHMMVMW